MAENNTNSLNTQNNENTPTKAKHFRYPLRQIRSNTDYLEIKVVNYAPPGIESEDKTLISANVAEGSSQYTSKTKILSSICLPIPQNISDNNSVTWGEDNLNPLQAIGLNAISKVGTGKVDQGSLRAESETFIGKALGNENLKRTVMATAAQGLYNAFGGNVNPNSIISRATGKVFNSNLELLFQGPNIRTFPFAFEFVPRDRSEASEVKNIIRTFKTHMSTKKTGTRGIFFQSPDVFLLKYKTGNQDHPFLNKFKPCALIDMNVIYTASGTYATYQDSTPVHLQMTLTFKELNPIYGEDYNKEEGLGGVGY